MFKIWSIVILAVTMLFAGIAVMSLGNREATPQQLQYTGDWLCTDGSGERANIVYSDKSYQISVIGSGGNTLVSCSSGKIQDASVVFKNASEDMLGEQQPCAYITVQYLSGNLIINGYSAGPRVFKRTPGSAPQDAAY